MKNAITLFFYFISSGPRTDPSTSGGKRTLPTGDSSYYQSSTCASLV